jgi:hypothetical protein
MLFDLQSRGRKTAVKIVYLGLAILIGGGLVLFGVGTGGPGGLIDAFNNDTQEVSDAIVERQERAERAVRANPSDDRAWADLAVVYYQAAGQGENFNAEQGAFTEKGQEVLRRAESAWDRYLSLDPARPDANIARQMARVFDVSGLNEPAKAAEALEIVTEQDPSGGAYSQLAYYAYLADQERKGDLAARKAVELTPEAQRRTVRATLERTKREIQTQRIQDAIDRGEFETSTTR